VVTVVLALVVAALLAVVDWIGVVTRRTRLRWLGKPGVMVALVVAAIAAEDAPTGTQAWFVVALVLSLAGDVALLLPERWFLAGLVAFLGAHLAYIAGMAHLDLALAGVLAGLAVVFLGGATVGRTLTSSVARRQPALRLPVAAYLAVISTMVIVGCGTAEPWLVGAALLFYVSDALLGWNRFVHRLAVRDLAVMVTYHLAQFGFVLWLVTR
jgi:uncharacterized membrane protein YhhN